MIEISDDGKQVGVVSGYRQGIEGRKVITLGISQEVVPEFMVQFVPPSGNQFRPIGLLTVRNVCVPDDHQPGSDYDVKQILPPDEYDRRVYVAIDNPESIDRWIAKLTAMKESLIHALTPPAQAADGSGVPADGEGQGGEGEPTGAGGGGEAGNPPPDGGEVRRQDGQGG